MKDPIELEKDATEWLKLIGIWAGSVLLGILFLLAFAGALGIAVGLMARAAKWAMG